MPTSLMCHRYPYDSFAESSGERIPSNRRGLLPNERDIDGQQRKESAWFLNQRDSVCPRAAKCEGLRETSADRRVVDFL